MKPFDRRPAGIVAAALMLTACVGQMAPTVAVMPGSNKPFDAFSADQTLCRQYADSQIAPLRDQANANTLGSTLLGAGLGAALGGAIGGGRGAGIGAASGAVVGAGAGASNAQYAAMDLQQQYNMYYANCMGTQGGPPPGAAAPAPSPGSPMPPPPPRGY